MGVRDECMVLPVSETVKKLICYRLQQRVPAASRCVCDVDALLIFVLGLVYGGAGR
jgi:hypothetical protein